MSVSHFLKSLMPAQPLGASAWPSLVGRAWMPCRCIWRVQLVALAHDIRVSACDERCQSGLQCMGAEESIQACRATRGSGKM